ncbi:galactose mutarotase-like [Ostrea edulis]|uniref:galactose mutarotase-like n=1 Tax=Ostrea edulis TaxID=37623 RepID=UPI00209405B7|nr:galactose mutarotase-like [Ostrea edulis]XP_048746430.1 galactose mutarotase-like [Ostrea edulis]
MAGVTPTQDSFGTLKDGTLITRFNFTNSNHVTIRVIDFGATITDILVPDKNGKVEDISLGFDTVQDYESQHSYIGAALGRVTERIKGANFKLDGTEYKVSANDNNTHQVHGGTLGFDMKKFEASVDGDTVVMKYVSPDGEEGFPGEVSAVFTFRFTEDNELILGYSATTTKPTPVNLSNHVYFNLAGHGAGNIGDHILTVNSDRYIPLDKELIPLEDGIISNVKNTPFDFTTPSQLRVRMKDVLVSNYVFEEHGKRKHVARLELPSTGRTVDCYTTEPCMETYFSCAMRSMTGKQGATYGAFENGGICLIPMQYSSALNMPNFPDMILRPGQTYTQTTSYKFGF